MFIYLLFFFLLLEGVAPLIAPSSKRPHGALKSLLVYTRYSRVAFAVCIHTRTTNKGDIDTRQQPSKASSLLQPPLSFFLYWHAKAVT